MSELMETSADAKFKVIAIDLDGTLLTDEKTITDETKKWLRYAAERGVTVMFATGRGMQTAESFWKELALDSPMVMVNGAEIWKGPGKLHRRSFLPRDTVRKLQELAATKGEWYWGYSVESLTGSEDWTPEHFERDWMKFGIGSERAERLAAIREELEDWGTLEITRSAKTNLEISVRGVSKESGVREVCDLLGIEMKDVMAIGDHDNDIRLLRSAGLGVAMGNGEASVKSIAGAVTATNNENGVALAIRRFAFGLE